VSEVSQREQMQADDPPAVEVFETDTGKVAYVGDSTEEHMLVDKAGLWALGEAR